MARRPSGGRPSTVRGLHTQQQSSYATRQLRNPAAQRAGRRLTLLAALEDGQDADRGDARAGADRAHQLAVHQAHHGAGQVTRGHVLGPLLRAFRDGRELSAAGTA